MTSNHKALLEFCWKALIWLFVFPQNPDMLTRKIKLCHINAHITCRLCEGYLIDATTVTECLHTCRSSYIYFKVFSAFPFCLFLSRQLSSGFCILSFSVFVWHTLAVSCLPGFFLAQKVLPPGFIPRQEESWREWCLRDPCSSVTSCSLTYYIAFSLYAVMKQKFQAPLLWTLLFFNPIISIYAQQKFTRLNKPISCFI